MKFRGWLLFVLLLMRPSGVQALPRLESKLIFTREPYVWMMNPDGKEQRRIWQVPAGYGMFGGFSRDGKWAISYNSFNLYLHDLKRKRLRRLLLWNAGIGTFISFPAFSPDSKFVLCTIGSVQLTAIDSKLVKLNVAKNYSVLNNLAAIEKAALRPDIKIIDPEFGEISRALHAARWSSDGNKVVLAAGGFDLADFRHGREFELWTMNNDGSGVRRITNNRLWEDMPSFSPKSDKVVFVRHFSDPADDNVGGSDLFLVDADGTNEQRLTFNQNVADDSYSRDSQQQTNPLFSPNGNEIFFNGYGEIYSVSTNSKNLKKLTSGRLIQCVY